MVAVKTPKLLISGTAGRMENYVRAVRKAGAGCDAIYAPYVNADSFDGLILAGGGDLSPELFGGTYSVLDRGIDPVRERSDLALISAFTAQRKPILGICRGMQILNAAFGGTILQDLGEKNLIHSGDGKADRFHPVLAEQNSVFSALYGAEFTVNSYHHQAVLAPGVGFRILCRAEDSTAEGMAHESLPILAVQWHPERLDGGDRLIRYFICLCRQHQEQDF